MQHQLNTQGLVCPMPLLKLKLLLKQCQTGDQIVQSITDTRSVKDIPAWLEMKGYSVEIRRLDSQITILDIKIS